MAKVKYSKDVDALLIELSAKPVEYAEESGQFIVHFDKEGKPDSPTSCQVLRITSYFNLTRHCEPL